MVETNSSQQATQSPANAYEYNYSYIEPIAMVSRLPQSESFSEPWLVLIAKQAVNLAINTLIANRGDRGQQGIEDDLREFLRQTLHQTLEAQGPALKLKLVGALIGFLPEMLLRDALADAAAKESLKVNLAAGSPAADQVSRGIDMALDKLLEGLPQLTHPGLEKVAGSPTDADVESAKGVEIASQQLSQGLPDSTTEVKMLQGLPSNAAAVEVAKGIEASFLLQNPSSGGSGEAAATAADLARGAEAAAMLKDAPSAAVKTQVSEGVETALQRLVQNVPTQESDIEQFMSSNLVKVLGSDLIKPFAGRLLDGLKEKAPTGRPQQLADYEKLFAYIGLPQIAASFQSDEMFAWLRVAGPNPLMLERLTAADPRFPVTEAQYQSVMGASDSLDAAIQSGRAYLADYGILDGALGGTFGTQPQVQKYLYAPLALFAVPVEGGLMRPVAIQAGQNPTDYPVVTPAASGSPGAEAWLIAKTIVQIADANFHEGVSHFARTHLLIEPFVMATHRQLPPDHPLSRLLLPHFQGTLAINDSAKGFLVSALGGVNRLLSATIDHSRVLIVKGFQMRGFNAEMLPQRLKDRGVDQANLPVYPYRDDGLLIWNAVHDWATAYLELYYRSDAEVQNDAPLQAWAAELVAFDGGRLQDFGDAGTGQIATLAYLIDAVTLIIFTASAQHAAVNFPQNGIMSFAPAMPTAGYAPAPTDAASPTWLDLLPPLDQAQAQLNLLYLLGSVYFTHLGDYEPQQFSDSRVAEPLQSFQQQLRDIAQMIDQRNLDRPWAYDYLKPFNIPQSINI